MRSREAAAEDILKKIAFPNFRNEDRHKIAIYQIICGTATALLD